ncbi:hypothetical protein ENBRE01_0354 [Enteropsectra breve]|nr:hypothetical protein ENBRE01_0354 [Enteropsectra breve]
MEKFNKELGEETLEEKTHLDIKEFENKINENIDEYRAHCEEYNQEIERSLELIDRLKDRLNKDSS